MPSIETLGIDERSVDKSSSREQEIPDGPPPGIWNSDSPDLHAEMDRRAAEMEAGLEVELDWDELHRRLLARRVG